RHNNNMQINAIDYFEKGALVHSRDKIAVREQGRQFTFAELERFAKNLATLILKRQAIRNQPIPVFLPKGAQNIVADVGILYSANAYANLDIKSPPQRLKGMLQNLNPAVIITSAPLVPALRALDIPEEKLLLVENAMVADSLYDNAALLKRLESV